MRLHRSYVSPRYARKLTELPESPSARAPFVRRGRVWTWRRSATRPSFITIAMAAAAGRCHGGPGEEYRRRGLRRLGGDFGLAAATSGSRRDHLRAGTAPERPVIPGDRTL